MSERSASILNDPEALSLALKAPLPARMSQPQSGMTRKYRLEDRLNGAGVVGSIAPPTDYELRAMTPTYSPPKSKRAHYLGIALLALSALTGSVVYRDMHRAPPAAPAIDSQ